MLAMMIDVHLPTTQLNNTAADNMANDECRSMAAIAPIDGPAQSAVLTSYVWKSLATGPGG